MTQQLSDEYQILARSPDPQNIYTGSPSLAMHPSGRLVASYEWFRPAPLKEQVPDQTVVLVSDDDGVSWHSVAALDFIWASVFNVGDDLYLLGNRRASRYICIARSKDGGENWSSIVNLFTDHYHCAPTHVLQSENTVYRAFETSSGNRSAWKSLVVAGDITQDLLNPSSWRMSNQIPFPGVPEQLTQHRYPPSDKGKVPHDSWLEGNVVEAGGEMRVILRTIIDGHTTAGIAAVCALQDDGGEMCYHFIQFYPMPGAQCKFHIIYDKPSQLFWTAVNIPTDTWQDRDNLAAGGFQGPPGNERRALVLMFSLDALNWFQAGFVAITPNPLDSFSYASLLPVGNDLLIIARTSLGGKNQHDTNLITLHRVNSFRSLAPMGFIPVHINMDKRKHIDGEY